MSGEEEPECLPYYLIYQNYYELDNKAKNLVNIIKYGDYHLTQKNLKNINSIIKDLRLGKQPRLLEKLQKKYFSLQNKNQNKLSWKKKPSITLPRSIQVESMLKTQPSIKVLGKFKTRRKKNRKKLSYSVVVSAHINKPKKKNQTKLEKKKVTRKRKQTGGSDSPKKNASKQAVEPVSVPSVKPRVLVVDEKLIPTTLKLIRKKDYPDARKDNQRILFRLDFQLPDGSIQKLFFKVALSPKGVEGEFNLPECTDYRMCNSYMYESYVYHYMNLKSRGTHLHQNILNIFGFGYTSRAAPSFFVKYDTRSKRIVGTETPTHANILDLKLNIPIPLIQEIQELWEKLEPLDIFSSTHISYNITEFTDEYIPLRHSKKINTEDKVVKVILGAAGITSALYNEYGFVHGDLHDLNYLVKDEDVREGDLPPDFIKFYDFDLSMLVNHKSIKPENRFDDIWIGNVTHIYSEIYEKILKENLNLFGKLLSLFDFYRIFCNCGLTHDDGSTLFEFTGMTFLKDVYLKVLSDGKHHIIRDNFSKILAPVPARTNDLDRNVISLALEYKKYIVDDLENKKMLQERFTDEEYNYIKDLLIRGFNIDPEFYTFTLPWWFTIWCVWTDGAGEFLSV